MKLKIIIKIYKKKKKMDYNIIENFETLCVY